MTTKVPKIKINSKEQKILRADAKSEYYLGRHPKLSAGARTRTHRPPQIVCHDQVPACQTPVVVTAVHLH